MPSDRTKEMQKSRDKAADLSLMLFRMAIGAGDEKRVTLARAGLRAAGYPGGEGAPTIEEAMEALDDS